MSLLLLPKELQDLIGEFNVEHRPKMRIIMNELLEKHEERILTDSLCTNCEDNADENYSIYIFWNKYTFCGGRCQHEGERYMRKSYRIKN